MQLSCSSREGIPSFLHGESGDGSTLLLPLRQSCRLLLSKVCARRWKTGGLGVRAAPCLEVAGGGGTKHCFLGQDLQKANLEPSFLPGADPAAPLPQVTGTWRGGTARFWLLGCARGAGDLRTPPFVARYVWIAVLCYCSALPSPLPGREDPVASPHTPGAGGCAVASFPGAGLRLPAWLQRYNKSPNVSEAVLPNLHPFPAKGGGGRSLDEAVAAPP